MIPPIYTDHWNPELALWSESGPGHTPETYNLSQLHSGRVAAWRLLNAGIDNLLHLIESGRTLRTLSTMQQTSGPRPGGFRWYWEEQNAHDTNATFFTTLPLILLELEFGDQLPTPDSLLLRHMLSMARNWFTAELEHLEHSLRYPNKTLGDLTCAWLMAVAANDIPATLLQQMARSADYYRQKNWGWGEHLSDGYATICQSELTAILLYANLLPPPLRHQYEELFTNLNTSDALFKNGPRVPAIRSYNFDTPPCFAHATLTPRQTFLDTLSQPELPGKQGTWLPLRLLAKRHNLAQHYHIIIEPQSHFTTPCFNDTQAHSIIHHNFRMGVMSRYPIMPDTEHPTWGLCWQSMPLCYWDTNGAWAYAQWETTANGTTRAHPAHSRHHRGAVQLDTTEPPTTGQTIGTTIDDQCLALRTIDPHHIQCNTLTDRFRLINNPFTQISETRIDDWYALTLHHPATNHTLRILCHPLNTTIKPVLHHPTPETIDWNITHPNPRTTISTLWLWQAGPHLPSPPPPYSIARKLLIPSAASASLNPPSIYESTR